jgi:hypothetical protein
MRVAIFYKLVYIPLYAVLAFHSNDFLEGSLTLRNISSTSKMALYACFGWIKGRHHWPGGGERPGGQPRLIQSIAIHIDNKMNSNTK